jgi:hypothetical protein
MNNSRLCWNCEIVEVEADECFCSMECYKESSQAKEEAINNG